MMRRSSPSSGLDATFSVLRQVDGDAAARVLVRGFDSPRADIARGSLATMLRRRSTAGHREILRRWEGLSPEWREVVKQQHDRMDKVLREAVLSNDQAACRTACNAALWLEHYDLIPSLVHALQEPVAASADMLAETLLGLAERLYRDLSSGAVREEGRRDPQMTREQVVSSLEEGVQRFVRHRRREVLEAFALLAKRDNVTLKQVLQDPHHSAFVALVDVLAKSERPGLIRLLLNMLDDPHAPSAGLSVLGNRTDMAFLRHLLKKVGRDPSVVVRQNLKRITSIAWLRNLDVYLAEFDDHAQQAALRLAITSGLPRPQCLSMIEYLLARGKPGGRRAAAESLGDFAGAEANAVALRAMEDSDPLVQAAVIGQLRRRGIPGVLARLVDLLDSPHVVVRQAVRRSLAEFSFKRFVGAFDMLDDEVRHSTGLLVRKVDPQALPLLQEEMRSKVRSRRLRGLAMARAMDAVTDIEPTVLDLLGDEDHLVRVEAATALSASSSELSADALREALRDRSEIVQGAARKSLEMRHEFVHWRTKLADPRD